MQYSGSCAFSTLAAIIALALPAEAQSVISTRSGVIHFFEGAVYLGDQPLESHLGRFLSVPQGAELRTAEGRAEVLLTPGVFLRMGERTTIRMIANDLADTQVELRTGSAIVDSGEPNLNTSVTLIYEDWRIHFLQKGVYRIDSHPPCLLVRQGEAEVFAATTGQPISVEQGMSLPLADLLVPEESSKQSNDALSDWANGRSESISADNAITAQIDEDPSSRMPGLDGFTSFPFIGVPIGLGSSSLNSSSALYQPGFNSIYLPGYTYQPLLVGLAGRGYRTYLPSSTWRIGVSPGAGAIVPFPRVPFPRSPVTRFPVPLPAPMRPAPPHAGVRGAGHR